MAATSSSLFWKNWSRQESTLIPACIHIRIVCVNDVINLLDKHSLSTFKFLPTEQANTSYTTVACSCMAQSSKQACVFPSLSWHYSVLIETEHRHIVNGMMFRLTQTVINYVNKIQATCFGSWSQAIIRPFMYSCTRSNIEYLHGV